MATRLQSVLVSYVYYLTCGLPITELKSFCPLFWIIVCIGEKGEKKWRCHRTNCFRIFSSRSDESLALSTNCVWGLRLLRRRLRRARNHDAVETYGRCCALAAIGATFGTCYKSASLRSWNCKVCNYGCRPTNPAIASFSPNASLLVLVCEFIWVCVIL